MTIDLIAFRLSLTFWTHGGDDPSSLWESHDFNCLTRPLFDESDSLCTLRIARRFD